ncbi:transglycosylase family protein [Luteococcus sanguinis]|uniref:Transglycosylase family protein n=1 Tax=Luteococcus sanguinis TaxID=174038 RepID=A0ABW1X0Q3_9ACTN
MKKPAIISSAVGALALVMAGGVGVAHADKSVNLQVEGQDQTVHTFGSTVGDALDKAGIEVGEHDQVVPSTESTLSDGQQVVVRYGRQLTVTVDGAKKTFWTTATTVDDALAQIGVRDAGTRLSVSRSTALGREGLTFSAVTPKTVSITADGKTASSDSTSDTVKVLLAERQVKLGAADTITPAVGTKLTDGLKVVIKRVTTKKVTETSTIEHESKEVTSSSLAKGTEKLTTKGVDGTTTKTYTVTLVDGKQTSKKLVSTKVTTQPVTEVTTVGTKVEESTSSSSDSSSDNSSKSTTSTSSSRSSSSSSSSTSSSGSSSTGSASGLNLSNSAMWDRIAQCESGGNWSINTGNGYYGGLQFDSGTWLSAGGGKYAARADLASRAQQITIANALYASRGLSPWGCAGAA